MSAKRRFALENREASRAQWRQQAEQRLAKAVEEFFSFLLERTSNFPPFFVIFHVFFMFRQMFSMFFHGFSMVFI